MVAMAAISSPRLPRSWIVISAPLAQSGHVAVCYSEFSFEQSKSRFSRWPLREQQYLRLSLPYLAGGSFVPAAGARVIEITY
jgi:hypothetical protein